MANRSNLYLGRGGQLAVMSEFLVRGWNVAIPEVDVGDDILVVRDEDGSFSRIQVKTSSATTRKYGYSSRFRVPLGQLRQPVVPELTYIFAVRHQRQWSDFVVISREDLWDIYKLHAIGTNSHDSVLLTLEFRDGDVACSGIDISSYLNDFSDWPDVAH